jgi:hypothetical protein
MGEFFLRLLVTLVSWLLTKLLTPLYEKLERRWKSQSSKSQIQEPPNTTP